MHQDTDPPGEQEQDEMKAQAITQDPTLRIYRTIQMATVMFLIGLIIGVVMRGNPGFAF